MKFISTFTIAWIALITIAAATQNNMAYPVTIDAFFICLIGTLAIFLGFSISSVLINARNNGCNDTCLPYDPQYRFLKKVLLGMVILGAFGAFLSFQQWKDFGINFSNFSLFLLYDMNVAYAAEGGLVSGFAGRLVALNFLSIVLASYLFNNKKLSRSKFLVVIALSFLFLLSPRRALMFYSLAALFLALLFFGALNFKRKLVFSSISVILFILVFGFSQFYLGKLSDSGLTTIVDSVSFYLFSSFNVMSTFLDSSHFNNVAIILNTPARIANEFFDTDFNVDLSIPFVDLHYRANTVPAYYYIFKDVGVFGLILYCLLLGAITSCFYYSFKRKGTFFSYSILIIIMVGLLFSPREMIFITYDFWFWISIVFFIKIIYLLRNAILRAK